MREYTSDKQAIQGVKQGSGFNPGPPEWTQKIISKSFTNHYFLLYIQPLWGIFNGTTPPTPV